ncbi:GntR family transcriptional regulator [Paenibacillus sp. y28]|uniref:GntR family transcriptional regulator n=1 Tax=Paenibacillus sp. y28 TaxID=3129110 RepID=UPI003017C4B3
MTLQIDISAQVVSIREKVYETLKEAILNGSLPQGAHLKERDIAHNFGISTTPVKEALRRLDQEGLVLTKPRIGTFVSSNIMRSVEEISWARSALEGVAARLAAIKITDEECRRLEAQIGRMEQATAAGNGELLYELNEAFHRFILTVSQNDYIVQQIHAVRAFDKAVRKQALSDREELERAIGEHRLIYECIIRRDPDAAEQAMVRHIRRTASFVTNSLKVENIQDIRNNQALARDEDKLQ